MITFDPTTDLEAIRRILVQPHAWDAMVNDSAPAPEAFQIPPSDIEYVVIRDDGRVLGMFLLVGNEAEAEIHFCCRPTTKIGKAALEWVWQNTKLQRLIGPVPSYNRVAARLAFRLGFRKVRRVPSGQMKNGELYDLIVTSLQRPISALARDGFCASLISADPGSPNLTAQPRPLPR